MPDPVTVAIAEVTLRRALVAFRAVSVAVTARSGVDDALALARRSQAEITDALAVHVGARPPFLRVREAASIAGVTAQTIREWVERGWLPAAKLPGGFRIHRNDLHVLLGDATLKTPEAPRG